MPYLTQRDSQLGSKPGLTDVSFDCSDSQSVWSRWWLLLIFGSIWLMSYLTSASSHFLINSPPQLETLVTLLLAVPIIISLNHLNHCISSKRYLPLMWDFWPQLNIVIAYLDLQHKECRCLLTLIVNETEVLLQFLVNISTKKHQKLTWQSWKFHSNSKIDTQMPLLWLNLHPQSFFSIFSPKFGTKCQPKSRWDCCLC